MFFDILQTDPSTVNGFLNGSTDLSKVQYYRLGKRLLDLAITIPALIILLPVLALAVLLVRIRLGLLVLFRQQRPGLHGKPFTIYKFRTMTDARNADGCLMPSAWRPLAAFCAAPAWTQ